MSSEANRTPGIGQAVKVSVVYYSSTGTIHQIASEIATAAEKVGAEVRLRRIAENAPANAIATNPSWGAHLEATKDVPLVSHDDLIWADAVLFGSPTRFGNTSSQFQQFVDGLSGPWSQGLLSDKVYSAFTSSITAHGGQEITLQALYATIHHWGGVVVAPGYTDPSKFVDGNPYGTSFTTGNRESVDIDETTRTAARFQAERVVRIAGALRRGLDSE